MRDGAGVVVVGAGPAGLVLGNLLLAEGIGCVILERGSRAHVEARARAGFLGANSVRVLVEHGLAAGLLAKGQPHGVCAFRGAHGSFELAYGERGRGELHTVYPQQSLVTDLIASFLERGGDLRFESSVIDVDAKRAAVRYKDADGVEREVAGRFVAGCDGSNGVSRAAIPDALTTRYQRDHGIAWLAILAEAPQSMTAVTYAVHPNGFAGHMARSPSVTRYYLQCPPEDSPESWSDERIWDELRVRMRCDLYGPLHTGAITERRIVRLRSDVIDPIQYHALFLAGDAASLISPSAAKGANLAIMAAEVLAKGMIEVFERDDETALGSYSATVLPRIWRAQEFSQWMINLLHGPIGLGADFSRALQTARLVSLRDSRTHQDFFAEHYVGI